MKIGVAAVHFAAFAISSTLLGCRPAPAGVSSAGISAPRLYIENKSIEMDANAVMESGSKARVRLENRGSAPLVIRSLTGSCSCASIAVTAETMKPGDEAYLLASIARSDQPSGEVAVKIESTDVTAPVQTVLFTWELPGALTWAESRLEAGILPLGSVYEFYGELRNPSAGTIQADEMAARSFDVRCEGGDVLEIDAAHAPLILGKLTLGHAPGARKAAIHLLHEGAVESTLVLAYECEPYIKVVPPALAIFGRSGDGPFVFDLSAIDGRSVTVRNVAMGDVQEVKFNVAYETRDDVEFAVVTVFPPSTAENGAISSSISFSCETLRGLQEVTAPIAYLD
jgi:hypothetical protein